MWPAQQYKTGLYSNVLPGSRPWTPPDMDSDDSSPTRGIIADLNATSGAIADSGYFGDALAPPDHSRDLWSRPSSTSSDRSHPPSKIPTRRRAQGHKTQNSASGRVIEERPYTPTKPHQYSDALHYPTTPPDSARISVKHTDIDTYEDSSPDNSPLPSRLWASASPIDRKRTSPVQNALFSCLNNLERLIGTSQPDAEQMEYIIERFETLTAYLSAPESQSKGSDEHLFSELENSMPSLRSESPALSKDEAEAYVVEVGKFIEGVKAHAADMKTRLDEVKQLNEVNVDVITNLHKELRVSKETIKILCTDLSASQETIEGLQEELRASQETVAQLREESTCSTTKAQLQETEESSEESDAATEKSNPGLFASVAGALDFVSDLLYEW